MAISTAAQTLAAAFVFGILLQAAAGSLGVFLSGHGNRISQDGRRLALMVFLIFVILWALTAWLNLLVAVDNRSLCQVGVEFSTTFDQLARVGMEQFLLGSLNRRARLSTGQATMQAILVARLVIGAVLVGFVRADFAPACVAQNTVVPLAVVALVLDFLIGGVVFAGASILSETAAGRDLEKQSVSWVAAGLIIWEGSSVVMLLALHNVPLLLRTLLPAIGLLMLIYLITVLSSTLIVHSVQEVIPEARSPFGDSPPISQQALRDGSPVVGVAYTNSRSLFIVNPSATPFDSPVQARESKGFLFPEGAVEVNTRAMPDGTYLTKAPTNHVDNGINALAMSSRSFTTVPLEQSLGKVPTMNAPANKGRRSLFSRTASPSKTKGLNISGPIVKNDQGFPGPSPRMQTTDLATALALDRDRRLQAAARSRQSALFKSPIQQATITPQDDLQKSVSVKRKAVTLGSGKFQGTRTVMTSTLTPANATSTSRSLSPGHDDVRRRSPRSQEDFERMIEEKETLASPPKRAFTGVPDNPRQEWMAKSQEQTVMLMNDIVYDDPVMVEKITREASGKYAAAKAVKTSEGLAPESYAGGLKSSGSIIHRPRPYKRKADDRGIFSSEPSPRHRRSRSGSSNSSRRSLRTTESESPTGAPPLPPPPTSAAGLTHILSEETRAMTLDERIELLFPLPPAFPVRKERRSSVPDVPLLPFLSPTPAPKTSLQPIGRDVWESRASRRSTISGLAGLSGLAQQIETENLSDQQSSDQPTFRFSARTYQTLAADGAEVPHVRPQAQEGGLLSNGQLSEALNTRGIEPKSAWTGTSFDETSPRWDLMPSTMPSIVLSQSMFSANQPWINRESVYSQHSALGEYRRSQIGSVIGGEIMTVMLDTAPAEVGAQSGHEPARRSIEYDDSSIVPTSRSTSTQQWHRRIGDTLPTFSEPRADRRSRKIPPPTPLRLSSKGIPNPTIVQQAELSPLESPERALQEIQAQLQHLEGPERDSLGSLQCHMPERTSLNVESDVIKRGRLSLLNSLENELGQQEDYWQQLHKTLDRDSISTTMSRPASIDSQTIPLRESLRIAATPSPYEDGTQSRSKLVSVLPSSSDDDLPESSLSTPKRLRARGWRRRLAEAESEYVERAPCCLRKQELNFFAVPKAGPTPPESDIDTASESEAEVQQPKKALTSGAMLWEPRKYSLTRPTNDLWSPNSTLEKHATLSEPPALSIRPAQRRIQNVLQIQSTKLWSKPCATIVMPFTSLWRPKIQYPVGIVRPPRPVTQRPLRRSKRITALPDIVENPVPVPNKRDTLGLFQYPWGETSDSAVYQTAFNPALIPGLVSNNATLNATLDRRSRQLEAKEADEDYSKSFFDEYEDEDKDLDELDAPSDDDFDESTLWEIANLLKSNEVPSKHSLLPAERPRNQAVAEDSDSEYEEEAMMTVQYLEVKLPIMPLAKSLPRVELLWNCAATMTRTKSTYGLIEPKPSAWQACLDRCQSTVRSRLRTDPVFQPTSLKSSHLWTASAKSQTQHHWISESSILLNCSSVYSADSSARSSPTSEASDVSSLRSTNTKASSIPSSGITVPAWWDKKGSKKGALSPAPIEDTRPGSKIPVHLQPTKPLPNVREFNVLTSRDQGEKQASMSEDNLPRQSRILSSAASLKVNGAVPKAPEVAKSTALESIESESTRPKKLTSLRAPKADWDMALVQAIRASKPKVDRIRASSEDGNKALNEAVAASRPAKQHVKLDSAVLHPVFFARTMISSTSEVHPAATGYIKNPVLASAHRHDAAIRHPVFFTGNFSTTSSSTHPAATGYVPDLSKDNSLPRSSKIWRSPAIESHTPKLVRQGSPNLFAQIEDTETRFK